MGWVALAALLVFGCATPGPPPPDTGPTAREDPFLIAPDTGYPMTGVAELSQRVEAAYQRLMAGLRGAIEAGELASFVERFYRRIAAGPDAGFPD